MPQPARNNCAVCIGDAEAIVEKLNTMGLRYQIGHMRNMVDGIRHPPLHTLLHQGREEKISLPLPLWERVGVRGAKMNCHSPLVLISPAAPGLFD